MFLLSTGLLNKRSKQQFATSLAAAVLLSGISATTTGAQPANRANESRTTESRALEPATGDKPVQLPNASAANTSETYLESGLESGFVSDSALGDDILVYPHDVDGRQAATLYVKDIPVLTFLGTDVDSLANGTEIATAEVSETAAVAVPAEEVLENNPVLRATELGSQLNLEAVEAATVAADISVRWQEETEGFVVTLADEDLIALDSRTVLADTTEDAAEDALQVTNRLRRLIGDADPVAEIEGMPEPEPEPVVETPPVQQVAVLSSTVGSASWYGPGFNGRLTANGETFNQYAMTAAHRTLPFGTRVLVTNLYTGRQVVVRINDRGPFVGNRVIDLSKGAAAEIGLLNSGIGTVQIDILSY
ncbi:MAG: septal ring lytic transglycosylase RlpA family protein [Cyanobacteria bacterium P01_D01_bin.1]